MRVAWLLLPGLAALALTVPTGCHRISHRAQARAKAAEARVQKIKARVQKAVALIAPPAPQPVAEPAEDKVIASWEVKGWGRDQAEAEQNALEKGRGLVIAQLRQQEPPLVWTPSTTYIRKHLVTGSAKRHEEDDQAVAAIQTKCWSLSMQLTAGQLREMVKLDRTQRAQLRRAEREHRTEHRMWLAGGVTAGILLLTVVVGGFLRLDDWTGGACTRRLLSIVRCPLSVARKA